MTISVPTRQCGHRGRSDDKPDKGLTALLRQCLELNRKTRGAEHPNTAATLHDLALITAARGDAGAAEAQFRIVLAMQRKALGSRHPVVATTLNSLSHVLLAQGRHDEAAAASSEALDIARAALRSDHQLVAIYTLNLAAVHLARKDSAAAEPLLREGLRIRERAAGIVPSRRRTVSRDHWSVEEVESLLGTIHRSSQGAQKGSPASTSRTGTSGTNDRSQSAISSMPCSSDTVCPSMIQPFGRPTDIASST
jgi:tetratricopeptide (TPR) repeat protein